MARRRLAMTAAALVLSGCAVGPDFKAPATPTTQGYTTEPQPPQTLATDVDKGEPQHFQVGSDLPGQWWTLFESDKLNALIEQAMQNYPDIAAQQAALRAARDNVRAQQGVFLPQLGGSMNAERTRQSGATIGPGYPGFVTSLFTTSLNVSYTLDVFGGERRQLENLRAQVDGQKFQLEASYLTLTSNLAATAVSLASARDQIAVTQEIIALEEKALATIQRQYEAGARTRADLLQQQSNLATVRATLPKLQQQLQVAEHQLAVLTGRFPHDVPPLQLTLEDLKLPQELPVSLPSALVAQRPDVQQQQALMHQASANIGVATANLLPQIQLSSAIGDESLTAATLFTGASELYSLSGALTQPLFQGGTLRAKRRAAIDAYEQAGAQYQLTVLNAFQNVADTLTALDNDAQALRAQTEALSTARSSLDLIQRQYDAGAVSYTSLLSAQQAYQQARIAYVQTIASRFTDTIALFQALGGGWWNRKDAA